MFSFLVLTNIENKAFRPISLTHMKEDKLDEIRDATLKDDTLKVLGDMILRVWPDEKQHVPEVILPYFSFRDELVVHKGMIIRSEQIVITVCLRESMRKKVYMSYLGIKLCVCRARDLGFWPDMLTDICEYIEKCGVCSTYQGKQPS